MREEILRLLGKTKIVGQELQYFEVLDSTNTYVKQIALEGAPNGTVVIADGQTGGRGRVGRTFQSSKGRGLYLTALLRPELPPDRLPLVTALAGAAVCSAVEVACGVRPSVKWPNDLVLGGKKLSGILTELVMDGKNRPCVVLGIGVNVSQRLEDFSPEVAEIATSLEMALGKPVSRPALAAALIRELDHVYTALKSSDLSGYLAAYRRDCVNLGKMVQLIAAGCERETAIAVDIDEGFGLVVRGDDGRERTIRSGEVSVRGLYGYLE